MTLRSLLLAALLAALLAGCGGRPAAAPWPSPTPDAAGLALESYGAAIAGPADAATLRRAFDQVELALAVAPAGRRDELLAAEGDLVERLALLQTDPAPAPTAAPTPDSMVPAGAPTPAPVATATRARRAPTPVAAQPPAFAVVGRKSFEGSGASGQFASCVDVQVLDGGAPVSGAVLGINNGDLSYQDQTDQGGYSGRCGLGASTWSVVLFWTPARGTVQGAATTVYLSGAPEQRAAIVFAAP